MSASVGCRVGGERRNATTSPSMPGPEICSRTSRMRSETSTVEYSSTSLFVVSVNTRVQPCRIECSPGHIIPTSRDSAIMAATRTAERRKVLGRNVCRMCKRKRARLADHVLQIEFDRISRPIRSLGLRESRADREQSRLPCLHGDCGRKHAVDAELNSKLVLRATLGRCGSSFANVDRRQKLYLEMRKRKRLPTASRFQRPQRPMHAVHDARAHLRPSCGNRIQMERIGVAGDVCKVCLVSRIEAFGSEFDHGQKRALRNHNVAADNAAYCHDKVAPVFADMTRMRSSTFARLAISSSVNSILNSSSKASMTCMCLTESHSSSESRELWGVSDSRPTSKTDRKT